MSICLLKKNCTIVALKHNVSHYKYINEQIVVKSRNIASFTNSRSLKLCTPGKIYNTKWCIQAKISKICIQKFVLHSQIPDWNWHENLVVRYRFDSSCDSDYTSTVHYRCYDVLQFRARKKWSIFLNTTISDI